MKTYSLYGYINFLDVESGFVTPVFKDDKFYYSQVERNNKVTTFARLPNTYESSIKKIDSTSTTSEKGQLCIYAYYHVDGVFYGKPDQLAHIFNHIQPDKEIISSFLNRNNIQLMDLMSKRLSPKPKNKFVNFSASPALIIGSFSPVMPLANMHYSRSRFYSRLKEKAIFKTPEFLEFIAENQTISEFFNAEIREMMLELDNEKSNNLSGVISFLDSSFSPLLVKLNLDNTTRSTLIASWLDAESEAQEMYEKALNFKYITAKIKLALEWQLDILFNSYEKLRNLFYQHQDVES